MTSGAAPAIAPEPEDPPPQPLPAGWSERVWLARLDAAVGPERRAGSPIAAILPAMLVALGWPGTGRSLSALLPPPDIPFSMKHLEQLLAEIGFRTRRFTAKGDAADTAQLRAGSLLQNAGGIAVYLGQPGGEDRWLAGGTQTALKPAAGDAIVAIEPDAGFHPVDEARPNWFRGLFERMRDTLFELLAMSTLINLLALAVSLYTMVVYSVVIPSGSADDIWGIAVFAAVTVVGGWVLRLGRQRTLSRLSAWAGTRIGEAAMRKMLSLPLDTSAKPGIQNNMIRVRSVENARQFLSSAGGTHLIDYPFIAIFLLVTALMGGWLVAVPVVALICYAAIAFPTADYVASKAGIAGAAAGRVEEQAGSAFLAIDAFRQASAGSQWLGRFADLAREAAARNRDYAIALARAQVIGQALSSLTVLATMCVGIVLVLDGVMKAGGLVAVMMLIWRIVVPAQEAFGTLVRLRQIRASIQQVNQLMAAPAERAGVEIASPTCLFGISLSVERLYYRPDADQEAALNGVSFSVPAGARVAIVGPNAGGKTALLECLAGLRRPQSGRVLLDGRDIRQFDASEYRAWIGYVPQVAPALPLTVRDYLRLRVPTLGDEDALRAFEMVLGVDWRDLPALADMQEGFLDRSLDPFDETPDALKRRHLVAFVAATLDAPAVLLLDGAGLGGDPVLDQRLERYLDTIRGRTTVIWAPYSVAHIQGSDRMVILERGTVRYAGPTAQSAPKTEQPATKPGQGESRLGEVHGRPKR